MLPQSLQPPTDSLMTQAAAAGYLSVNERTVRRLIADGQLPAHRVGSRLVRVRRSDVEKLLTRIPAAS